MPFVDEQPNDGDTILHCGHLDSPPFHWFEYASPLPFTRPDGSRSTARWLVACADCFAKSNGNSDRIVIGGDATWTGTDPVIKPPFLH